MSNPAFIEITEWQKKKLANDELIDRAAFVARNIPTACGIIRSLIEKLEVDCKEEGDYNGWTENFLFQLKYTLHAMEQDMNKLHQCLIDTGYKEALYYQD